MYDTGGCRKLRSLVERGEISQSTIARKLGVSQPSVSAWLLGRTRPESHYREAIERRFKIRASDWMTDSEYFMAFGRQRTRSKKAA